MKELRTQPLILADDAHPKTRMRVTWEKAPGWLGRLLGNLPMQVSAIYEGSGTEWYVYEGKPTLFSNPGHRTVGRELAELLSSIEARLLTSDMRDAR